MDLTKKNPELIQKRKKQLTSGKIKEEILEESRMYFGSFLIVIIHHT